MATIAWAAFDRPGWDVAVTYGAIDNVQAGQDPYADGVAQLARFHDAVQKSSTTETPYIYVYPPVTLPVLRAVGRLPAPLSHTLYWVAYIASTVMLLWFGMQFVAYEERTRFETLMPISVFFPGLLVNGTLLSGNIAIILYAAILVAAVHGWKKGAWHWFYLITLIASCVKGPLLLFALVPALSARKQWRYATLAITVGFALTAAQALIWPGLFKNYLAAIDLMFRYSHDFGCSPAGLFGDFLSSHGMSYSPSSGIFYAVYAVPLFATLVYLSRKYLLGTISLEQWIPVMLLGLTLLNPRIIEYDVAPITIPLALIGWRFVRVFASIRSTSIILSVLFILANCAASFSWELRKLIDGPLIVLFFALGSWTLVESSRLSEGRNLPPRQMKEHGMAGI